MQYHSKDNHGPDAKLAPQGSTRERSPGAQSDRTIKVLSETSSTRTVRPSRRLWAEETVAAESSRYMAPIGKTAVRNEDREPASDLHGQWDVTSTDEEVAYTGRGKGRAKMPSAKLEEDHRRDTGGPNLDRATHEWIKRKEAEEAIPMTEEREKDRRENKQRKRQSRKAKKALVEYEQKAARQRQEQEKWEDTYEEDAIGGNPYD